MHIAVVGTGYVGLVTGACFAETGVNVTCVDVDKTKIDNLNRGILPIYEPGLGELVERNRNNKRLNFTTNLVDVLDSVDIVFSAVGTPADEDGSADLHYVLEVARTVGRNMNKYLVVVTKSTVPVGTAEKVRKTIQEELDRRGVNIEFDVASNPEFLKEGVAIKDFMSPERVVVGTDSPKAEKLLARLYRPFMLNSFRVIFMDIPSAEMTKYAANAMLATRISFMNDIANLCELVGASVSMVRKGIASDSRIGSKCLYSGCGYGGSCFPKDVKALAHTAVEHGMKMRIIEAVEAINESQKHVLFDKLVRAFGSKDALKGKTIAIWGLAFKPKTDDMREAPSLVLINSLVEAGCKIRAYDPIAMDVARRKLGEDVLVFGKDMYDTVNDADALVVVTEWEEFRVPSWSVIQKAMKGHVVVDGRNIYPPEDLTSAGLDYYNIGHRPALAKDYVKKNDSVDFD